MLSGSAPRIDDDNKTAAHTAANNPPDQLGHQLDLAGLKKPERGPGAHNPSRQAWLLENERNKFATSCGLIWRDVTRGINMLQAFNRSRSTAAVPVNAATSVENSSDEILVGRIAAGDRLAMQVLFARHRT